MLIALVALYFLSGGIGGAGLDVFDKDFRKLVPEIVADEERAEAVVDEMKKAEKDFDGHVKAVTGLVKVWRKADADHSSGRAELQPLIEEARGHREEAQKAFIESLFEMRGQLTEEEWNKLFPRQEEDG